MIIMLPATVTQHRGVPGISYCDVIQKPADTQRVLSILEWVQKATKVDSIKKKFTFDVNQKWRVPIFVSVSS